MDPVSQIPLTPESARHANRRRIVVAFIIVALVLIAGAFVLFSHGQFDNKATSHIAVAWAVQTPTGSNWYTVSVGDLIGTTKSQAAPPGMSVTAIARTGTTTYVLMQMASSSTLYTYTKDSYAKVYATSTQLTSLAVSSDGKFAAFTQQGSTVFSSQVVVLAIGSGDTTTLGRGGSPVFVSVGGVPSVLYLAGNKIIGQTYTNGTWTKPLAVYTDNTGFSIPANITSDTESHIAFLSPVTTQPQEWTITSLNPIVISPTKIYNGSESQKGIYLIGSTLYTLGLSPDGTAISISNLSASSTAQSISVSGAKHISALTILPI